MLPNQLNFIKQNIRTEMKNQREDLGKNRLAHAKQKQQDQCKNMSHRRIAEPLTLYTLFLSVKVSNIEYMPFNIDTTSIGVIRLHISVNVTTSEKRIETLSNICNKREKLIGAKRNDKCNLSQSYVFQIY